MNTPANWKWPTQGRTTLATISRGRTAWLPRRAARFVPRARDLLEQGVRFLPLVAAGGFLLAVALVMTGAALIDRYGALTHDNFVAMGHQRNGLSDLVDLEDELADATSSMRGFVLSGHRDDLALYVAAATASRSLLQKIDTEQPKIDASAGDIVQQARNYLDALDIIVGKVERGDINAARAAAGPGFDRAATATLHSEIHARKAQLDASVLEHGVATERELAEGRRFNLMTSLMVTLVLVVFGALLRHYFSESQKASRALAAMNATLEQRIGQRTAELIQLSHHLLTIRDEERSALARDIHDEIGSELAALRMDCASVERASIHDAALAKSSWSRIHKTLDELTQAHRRIINSLHPTVLDHLGLEAAIRELLNERMRGQHIVHHLVIEGSIQRLPAEAAIAAYRVVQEALSNVLKHAKATQVSVVVRRKPSTLTVSVSDDGVGIAVGAAQKGRLGILGMRERARILGGSFHIGPGLTRKGTRVTARFRLEPEAASRPPEVSDADPTSMSGQPIENRLSESFNGCARTA